MQGFGKKLFEMQGVTGVGDGISTPDVTDTRPVQTLLCVPNEQGMGDQY
jgi:hypothetical protein